MSPAPSVIIRQCRLARALSRSLVISLLVVAEFIRPRKALMLSQVFSAFAFRLFEEKSHIEILRQSLVSEFSKLIDLTYLSIGISTLFVG